MFQANVIQGDSLEFDSLIYPTQHPNALTYIQNTLSNIPSTLMDKGRELFSNAYEKFKEITSAESRIRARNAILAATNYRQENVIYPIHNVVDSQTATLTMQRWIMAEPTVRELYHKQQCDGYSSTYVDNHPDAIGEDHYDYRRVMDGVVDYSGNNVWCKWYMEDLANGDKELMPFEKLSILDSWDVIRNAVNLMNEDPTDPDNGKLS